MQHPNHLDNPDDELLARLRSNTPRAPIGKHVLIVGVNPLNKQLFKNLAELQGCTAIVIGDEEEGLQRAIDSQPELIILDDGFRLAQSLKGDQRTRGIPLVVVSSHKESAVIAAGYEVHDVFVTKPIRVPEFLKTINRLLLLPS